MKKIAINGFGRIGRNFFKQSLEYQNEIQVVAVNDLGDVHNLAYLLKYDSVYRGFSDEHKVEVKQEDGKNYIVVDGREVLITSEREPKNLPWSDLEIDVVVESTGFFITQDLARGHIEAGAKRVVISAPAKDDVTPQVTPGLAHDKLNDSVITSNASCTTNGTNPVMAVMHETLGVTKAMLTTVHAYTASQSLVDGMAKKDLREGRAGAMNLVPSSTGAAKAVGKVIPDLKGIFDGVAVRVPVVSGSIIDITFVSGRKTTVEEVNQLLTDAAKTDRWKEVFAVTNDPVVSTDILGMKYASLVDLEMTRVVDGDLVKVMTWYDNEWGYTAMLIKHVRLVCDLV
jgi:glyceraldehyde 3-phosphate dehydrogenase